MRTTNFVAYHRPPIGLKLFCSDCRTPDMVATVEDACADQSCNYQSCEYGDPVDDGHVPLCCNCGTEHAREDATL